MATEISRHDSMRGEFAYLLFRQMEKDDSIVVVTADLGFGLFDNIKKHFPNRFYNVGASEQAMVGISVGMALEKKKVFAYSITPFLLKRPFETIDLYIEKEQIPVRLVGGGLDKQYKHDGPSHHFLNPEEFMRNNFPNIQYYRPYLKSEIKDLLSAMVKSDKPSFIGLSK